MSDGPPRGKLSKLPDDVQLRGMACHLRAKGSHDSMFVLEYTQVTRSMLLTGSTLHAII